MLTNATGRSDAGDNSLFAREDYVEEAWRIVIRVEKRHADLFVRGEFMGPAEVARVTPPGGWTCQRAVRTQDRLTDRMV